MVTVIVVMWLTVSSFVSSSRCHGLAFSMHSVVDPDRVQGVRSNPPSPPPTFKNPMKVK